MNNLFLKYQFTDRAGRHVYNICPVDDEQYYLIDIIRREEKIIGQIRLKPGTDHEHLNCWIDWVPTDQRDSYGD